MPRTVPGPTASGWHAIDAALAPVYGDQVPRHVAYVPPMAFSDNLQGCSAYSRIDHWHYVTYGLSNLFDAHQDTVDAEPVSGKGLELTLRVRRGDEDAAPEWPFSILNKIAQAVNAKLLILHDGHRLDMGGPVTDHPGLPDAPPTGLTVWAFTTDAELGRISTPNGRVQFLQAVGVTAAEKARMIDTSTGEVLAGIAHGNPLLITSPRREQPPRLRP